MITESLVVAALGGAAALLLFSWLRDLALAVAPATIPRVTHASLNLRTLAFTAFATTIAGLLLALGSLTFAMNRDAVRAVRQERGAGSKASGNRVRGALLVAQVSLATRRAIDSERSSMACWSASARRRGCTRRRQRSPR